MITKTAFQTFGFIGLGLIGGSIARAIREKYPSSRILVFDVDRAGQHPVEGMFILKPIDFFTGFICLII